MPPTIDPKFIPLAQAAKVYGYTRDHLGYLIRKGDLKGKKMGAYYYTTDDWMESYVESQKSRRVLPKAKKSLTKKENKSQKVGSKNSEDVLVKDDELHSIVRGLHERVNEHENKLLNFTTEVSRHLGVGQGNGELFENADSEGLIIDEMRPGDNNLEKEILKQDERGVHSGVSYGAIISFKVLLLIFLAITLGVLLSMSKSMTVVVDIGVERISSSLVNILKLF